MKGLLRASVFEGLKSCVIHLRKDAFDYSLRQIPPLHEKIQRGASAQFRHFHDHRADLAIRTVAHQFPLPVRSGLKAGWLGTGA
jgi:hypothetical protein